MISRAAFLRLLPAAAVTGCATATSGSAQSAQERNRAAAIAFTDMVFNQKRIREAFDAYVGPDYIQHNPLVPSGRDGSIAGLTYLMTNNPDFRFTLHRTMAEGDFVMLHAEIHHAMGDRGDAVVDIFRFENGKVVEHWDVVQPLPETARNDNTMF